MKHEFNDIVLSAPKRVVPGYSWVGHLPFAFWLVDELRPATIVELGTHTGNSYFSFCQAVKDLGYKAVCNAVDTWEGDDHTGFYGDEIFNDVNSYNDENYAEFSVLNRCTFDEALHKFPDGTIDLLHIDGLHTYVAVKHDFETWLPKMSNLGVIIFHDTCVKLKDFGVWKLWAELEKEYRSFEFEHSFGLGVLIVGKEPPVPIIQVFELPKEVLQVFKKLIESIGTGLLDHLVAKDFSVLQERYDKLNLNLDAMVQERSTAIQERDIAIRERDAVIQDRDSIILSLSWKITKPLRGIKRILFG